MVLAESCVFAQAVLIVRFSKTRFQQAPAAHAQAMTGTMTSTMTPEVALHKSQLLRLNVARPFQ